MAPSKKTKNCSLSNAESGSDTDTVMSVKKDNASDQESEDEQEEDNTRTTTPDESDSKTPKVSKSIMNVDKILNGKSTEVPKDLMCVAFVVHDILREHLVNEDQFMQAAEKFGMFETNGEFARRVQIAMHGDQADRTMMDAYYHARMDLFNKSVAPYAPHRAKKVKKSSRKVDLMKVPLKELEAAVMILKNKKTTV